MGSRDLSLWAGFAFIWAVVFPGAAVRADDAYKDIAERIAGYAERSAMSRIGVLKFVPEDGVEEDEALSVSEAVAANVAEVRKTSFADRVRLERLLGGGESPGNEEDAAVAGRLLGELFSLEAAVTGEVAASGANLKVLAKLNDIKTGRVLFTAEAEFSRTGRSVPADEVELPGFPGPYPWWKKAASYAGDLRDSVSEPEESSCAERKRRIAGLNSKLMDAKARYWAVKLNGPDLNFSPLGRNPGIEIGDPAAREKFYGLLAVYLKARDRAVIAPGELGEVIALLDSETRFLTECGFR